MAVTSFISLSPEGARRATGLAMLTATAFFFGGAMVAGKVAVAEVPPFTVAAARFAIAAVLLFALRLAWPSLDRGSTRPGVRDLPIIAALALSASAGYNILFLNGLRLSPATDASMIIPGLAPIVSTILAAIVLRDRPTRTAHDRAGRRGRRSPARRRPVGRDRRRIALSATRSSSAARSSSARTS